MPRVFKTPDTAASGAASRSGSKHQTVSSVPQSSNRLAVQAQAKVLLPVVQRMVQQLDALFVEFVGPVGLELAEDIFKQWLKTGKTGPSGLRQYAYSLSVQLDNPVERRQFAEHADQLLLQLQSGYIR